MSGFQVMLKAFGFDFTPEGLATTLKGFGIDISSKEKLNETLKKFDIHVSPDEITQFFQFAVQVMKRLDERSEETVFALAKLTAQLERMENGSIDRTIDGVAGGNRNRKLPASLPASLNGSADTSGTVASGD